MAGANKSVGSGRRGRSLKKKEKIEAERPAELSSGVKGKNRVEQLQSVRDRIFAGLPEIVGALIAKAEGGSYLHAKCLFELARISEVKLPKEIEAQGWAATMLRELRAIRTGSGQHEEDKMNPSSVEVLRGAEAANGTEA